MAAGEKVNRQKSANKAVSFFNAPGEVEDWGVEVGGDEVEAVEDEGGVVCETAAVENPSAATMMSVNAENFMRLIVCNFCARLCAPVRRSGGGVWRTVCALLLIGSLSSCAWLDTKERQLVLRPTSGKPANFEGLRPGDVAYALAVASPNVDTPQQIQMWWLPHANANAPTLLYLHGTFRNLYQNIQKINALREAGFAVLAVDYRGWGDSTPIVPSEASIYADANSAWAELVQRQANPNRRVIYGHSMGGGVAVELAHTKRKGVDYGALILESTFTRWPDVGAANGALGTVLSWFSSQRFASIDKIASVDAPVLLLHGMADTTVPISLGRRLFAAAPKGARMVEIEGGSHSNLQREAPAVYQQAMRALISKLP